MTTPETAAVENIREAWAALAMIREAIETLGPVGAVKASEHLAGPTFMHEAEALVEGIRKMVTPESGKEQAALERLLKVANSNTGQSRRAANFLLAWWNATDNGGFDLTDLWNVDEQIAEDMVTLFALNARARCYADHYGYGADMVALVEQWRRPKRRRTSR